MSELKQLGKEFAEIEKALLESDSSIDEARKIIETAQKPRAGQRTRRLTWALAGVVLLVASITSAYMAGLIRIGEPRELESLGVWKKAAVDRPLPVSFSDGSRIVFETKSEARIIDENEHGATVVLERGEARVEVIHRPDTRWNIVAGPFEINVTGTRFDLSWDPGSEELELTVHDGEVVVTGPMMGDGQRIEKNRRLVANIPRDRIEISSAGDMEESAQKETRRSETEDPFDGETNRPTASTADRHCEPTDWRRLLHAGKNEKALNRVVEIGTKEVLASVRSDKEILMLADAARLSGRLKLAEASYLALRARFPGSGVAATAAISLGRMAFDQRRDYGEAAKWLKVYLREQKGSSLKREALGRLMEAQLHSLDRAGAVETARQYLNAYPRGPHSAKARGIAESFEQ